MDEITISRTDFDVLYAAMELANNPYTNEDVPHLVALESRSWKILQRLRDINGLVMVPQR